jgi:hypothetical protein
VGCLWVGLYFSLALNAERFDAEEFCYLKNLNLKNAALQT